MENSLHLFRREASTTDLKWAKYLEKFIIDYYNKCLETNKRRLKVTEDLIAQYRCTMDIRNQQPLTDTELKDLHDVERRKAIDQFLIDTVVEWLPKPTPDSHCLGNKLDTEYQTIKAANSNRRDQVYSSLVEKWTAEYDKKMKASMGDGILRKNEFNEKHEKNFISIKASFAEEAPTDGPCYDNWSQTLQTKVSEARQDLFLENNRKQRETIWTLVKHHVEEFKTNVTGNLVEKVPKETDFEATKCSGKQKELKRFRGEAPVYVEPLDEWTKKLASEIDKVADTVTAEINSRKEERRNIDMYSRTLEQAFQQIDMEMNQDFGQHTAYISPEFIKDAGKNLKKYIMEWFKAKTKSGQSCPKHLLREIDEYIDVKETEYIKQNLTKKTKRTLPVSTEVPMTGEHHEKLRQLSSELVENVEVDATFIAHLTSYDVIPPAWADDLSNQLRPQRERTLTFLNRLEKRPDSAYEGFMRALKRSGQGHLALQLL